jgi:hypothetical protein
MQRWPNQNRERMVMRETSDLPPIGGDSPQVACQFLPNSILGKERGSKARDFAIGYVGASRKYDGD